MTGPNCSNFLSKMLYVISRNSRGHNCPHFYVSKGSQWLTSAEYQVGCQRRATKFCWNLLTVLKSVMTILQCFRVWGSYCMLACPTGRSLWLDLNCAHKLPHGPVTPVSRHINRCQSLHQSTFSIKIFHDGVAVVPHGVKPARSSNFSRAWEKSTISIF